MANYKKGVFPYSINWVRSAPRASDLILTYLYIGTPAEKEFTPIETIGNLYQKYNKDILGFTSAVEELLSDIYNNSNIFQEDIIVNVTPDEDNPDAIGFKITIYEVGSNQELTSIRLVDYNGELTTLRKVQDAYEQGR